MQYSAKVQNCALALRERLGGFAPRAGFILGTGLGGVADLVTAPLVVPYSSLPDFPLSGVASHAGQFLVGMAGGVPVIIQQGRCHLYEGYTPGEVCMGVRVMAELGVETLVATNAAGALNPQFAAGGLMVIADHINHTGQSPLTGPNDDARGPRFPDMSAAYDPQLIALAHRAALRAGVRLEQGVYLGLRGPELETPAETRAYRLWGADAVGMSTVLEVIAARHLGLRVLGLSCLTNKNLPDCMAATDIGEIIRVASEAGDQMTRLIGALVNDL